MVQLKFSEKLPHSEVLAACAILSALLNLKLVLCS